MRFGHLNNIMQKQIQSSSNFCDFCGTETYSFHKCLSCKKDCCSEHSVRFNSQLYFSTGADGYYCLECNNNTDVQKTPLYKAYQRIVDLSKERDEFHDKLKIKQEKAENNLLKLRAEMKLC